MDPKLKEQLYIRKHMGGIITVVGLVIILPLLIIFPQAGTQFQQRAAEIEKKPSNSQSDSAAMPKINQTAGNTQDYSTFIKCFDKPNQTPIISGQTNPCSPEQHKAADLNSDGIVDGIDYNLFVRKKTNPKITQ